MLDRNHAPTTSPLPLLNMPRPEVLTLSNGVRLNIVEGGTQDINDFTILFRGGQLEASNRAVAKIMGQSMPEGAAGLTGAQISEAIDFRGARVAVNCTMHHTVLTVQSLNSMIDGVFPIVKDILFNPTFSADTVAVMKERTAKAMQLNLSKVSFLSQMAVESLIMGANNPYASYESLSDIDAVNSEMLHSYRNRVVNAGGCEAFLSGKIPPKVKDEVTRLLLSIPNQKELELNAVPYLPQTPQTVKIEKADALQSSVRIALPAPFRDHPDYLSLRMAVIALGGYFGSRLMKNIREEKGLTYGINAFLLGSFEGSYIMISAQCDASYVDQVIKEVKAEFEKMATEPLDKEEFARLKQHIAFTLMQMIESPFSINDYYRTISVVGVKPGYFESQVECLKSLTPETIMEMARRYFLPEQMRIAVAGA